MRIRVLFYCLSLIVAWTYGSPLKASTNTSNVQFYLYSKHNPKTPQQLLTNIKTSVKSSHFDKTLQTKIIIHGWGGSYTSTPNGPIRQAYLETSKNYNIISVDWHEYAKLNYVSARQKVPEVGKNVADFVDFLNEEFNLNFDNLVVIGHSLGAHVAGYCGKLVKRGKLYAIVGLDPAFPLYKYDSPETRLSSSDARYVETIQTNGNVKGFLKPIGTASFYANWGRLQPGCGKDVDGACSHGRCVKLYAEAIRGYSFAPIYRCESFDNIANKTGCIEKARNIQIGDPKEIKHDKGIYNFKTNSEAPYGHLEF